VTFEYQSCPPVEYGEAEDGQEAGPSLEPERYTGRRRINLQRELGETEPVGQFGFVTYTATGRHGPLS
jgi:hypothetical protein